MSFKTTYLLYGLLACILLIFTVALLRYDESPTDPSTYVLPSVHDKANPFKDKDIDQVVVERTKPAEKFVFQREPGTDRWTITEPRGMRGDRLAINNLIAQILSAVRDEKVDQTASLSALGLDPAEGTITLKKGDERQVWIKVGQVTPGEETSMVFVTSSDRPSQAMGVRKRQLDTVLKQLDEFREKELLTGAESDIQAVKLAIDGKNGGLTLEKTADNRWRYKEPAYGEADEEGDGGNAGSPGKPPSGVRGLLRDLANLRVEYKDEKNNDFVADEVSDFAKYNLDPSKSEVLRIEIDRAEDAKKDDEGKEEKKLAHVVLLVGVGKKDGDKYYARRADENSVVRVSATIIDSMRKLLEDPGALRDRTLVAFRNFQTPDAMDVKQGAALMEFRREAGKPWLLYRGDVASTTDDAAVQGLISLLTQKNFIKGWPDLKAKESDLGLDKPSAVVSFWVDGIAKDEPKEDKGEEKKDSKKDPKKPGKPKLKEADKPAIRLSFGNVETDKMGQKLVNVKREAYGETTFVKVPELALERAKDGPLVYLDKSIPHFNESGDPARDVTKLTLYREGGVVEIGRAKEGEPWKIVQPKELAGRTADVQTVNNILGVLSRLKPAKLLAEKAKDDAELTKDYGLKPAALRAVVTVNRDGKDQNFEFLFGKELDDKQTQFAKQGDRDLIFTVDRSQLAALLKTDFLDPQIFKFDVAKVKALKLNGWKNVTGAAFGLDLERKDASQWTVKAPAGFNVDAGKVHQFLEELSNLRSERFATGDAKIKAAYDAKLKAGNHVLTVELMVEGEKEPLKLTVVNLDVPLDKEDEKLGADRGYYGFSNRTGGDLFKVKKTIFEGPMSKPTHFSP